MMTTFVSPARGASGASVAAPKWPVVVLGTVTTLAVLAIWPASETLWIAAAGYILGALAAPAVTVIYRFARRSAAKSPFFIPNRQLERLVLILLSTAVLAGMLNAWYVATELAKQ